MSTAWKPAPLEEKKDNQNDLGTLLGGFAHEIRNPLSTIGLNLKLLAGEWKEPKTPKEERAARRIELIQGEVTRLQHLLDEFLRIARPPTLRKAPKDLNRVLREIADFVEPELKRRNIRLKVFPDSSLPLVPVDSARLRQALLNLVLNAQAALETKEEGDREILLSSRLQGDKALLYVMDNGPGMSKETLERCWKPWFSTRPDGSGLGLSIARRIVRDHGGEIEAQSEPGKGTQFVLTLPLGRREEEKSQRRSREKEAPS